MSGGPIGEMKKFIAASVVMCASCAYYNCELFKGINFTLDYQLAADPAFNKDRGPINIFSARLRIKF